MRGAGLALGSLVALAWDDVVLRRRARWVAAAVLAATSPFLAWAAWRGKSVLIYAELWKRDAFLIRAVLPFAFACFFGAVLVIALEVPPLSRALSIAPFRWLARYSYGIYVFHMLFYRPLLHLLPAESLAARTGSANGGALLFLTIVTALTIPLAVLSYHGFEVVFLRMKGRLAGSR
jgi:peptidoglycan/LPS O-acetylase OafA/YrhL